MTFCTTMASGRRVSTSDGRAAAGVETPGRMIDVCSFFCDDVLCVCGWKMIVGTYLLRDFLSWRKCQKVAIMYVRYSTCRNSTYHRYTNGVNYPRPLIVLLG